MIKRYDVSGHSQAEFQPGSDGRVLANKLGITDPAEMDEIELDLLAQLHDTVLAAVEVDQRIRANDLSEWHRRWLGNIYPWAGAWRTVNLSKGEMMFAASPQIPRLMAEIDENQLRRFTPTVGMSESELAEAIATVHVELILIHPFREGNGRLSRLLANVMALQAGWPELDFSSWDADRTGYFGAIRAGLDDYGPMAERVRQALRDAAANDGA